MFTCKECGRKFKSKQGLGGHSAIHRNKAEAAPESGPQPSSQIPATKVKPEGTGPPEDEVGIMESIRKLKSEGYSARQIKEVFGYNRASVESVFKKAAAPESKPEEGEEAERDANNDLPATVKGTEAVTPEYIMNTLGDGSPEWRNRVEGMMILRIAQKMNREDAETTRMQTESYAILIKPILELMKETRMEQDAAAARAKESSLDVAQRAAFEVAQGMKGAFSSEMQALKASLPGAPEPPNPFMGLIFNAMSPFLGSIIQRVGFGLTGTWQPPGGFPGQTPTNNAAPGQTETPAGPPPGMKPGEESEFSEV